MERIAHERFAVFDQQRREADRLQADVDDLQAVEQIERELMGDVAVDDHDE